MSTDRDIQQLPRLLYISAVPVESTVAGSALMYRLLATWPADRLRVVEAGSVLSGPGRRLPNVEYRVASSYLNRLRKTRYAGWAGGRLFKSALRGGRRMISAADVGVFKPEAILTVAHEQSWAAAADAARRLKLPLHLIVHDDAIGMTMAPPTMAPLVKKVFGEVYRGAASRMCVSPYMIEAYEQEFGAKGDLLFPSRAAGAEFFTTPPDRLGETSRPLTYAYAGSIVSADYARSLSMLSQAVGNRGDRLLLFSNLTPDQARKAGLDAPHVETSPFIPFEELIKVLRQKVDVLFVPMSFDPSDRVNMQLSFPSKLTDYTAIGLPLLIRGPEYASAVRWAKENPGAAAVVEHESAEALTTALAELADAPRRVELARNAIRIGRAYFSHEAAFTQFVECVTRRPL